MTRERKMTLVEDIISGIICSDVWDKEQSANPEVAARSARLEGLMNAVRQYAPADLMEELENAIFQYASTYERVALLNGLHIADALRDVAARPSDYADLIDAKMKEVKA